MTAGLLILDTVIPWSAIERSLQKKLHTNARFGPNKLAETPKVVTGFVSRIIFLTFDWHSENSDENVDKLPKPKRAVLKVTGREEIVRHMARHAENVKDWDEYSKLAITFHNNEFNLYETANNVWKLPNTTFRLPIYYGGTKYGEDIDDIGYLIVEMAEEVEPLHFYDVIERENIVPVLKAMAKLGAMSLKHRDQIEIFNTEVIEEMLKPMLCEEHICNLDPLVEMVPELSENIKIIRSKKDIFSGLKTYKTQVERVTDGQEMLVHGDLWISNILWEKTANGTEMRYIIDWQETHLGSPAFDLVRVLYSCVSLKELLDNRDFYIKTYFDSLVQECGEDIKMPFTLEKLTETYERIFPLRVVPFLPFFAPMADVILKDLQGDEREAANKIYLDRARGCVIECAKYLQKWY